MYYYAYAFVCVCVRVCMSVLACVCFAESVYGLNECMCYVCACVCVSQYVCCICIVKPIPICVHVPTFKSIYVGLSNDVYTLKCIYIKSVSLLYEYAYDLICQYATIVRLYMCA